MKRPLNCASCHLHRWRGFVGTSKTVGDADAYDFCLLDEKERKIEDIKTSVPVWCQWEAVHGV